MSRLRRDLADGAAVAALIVLAAGALELVWLSPRAARLPAAGIASLAAIVSALSWAAALAIGVAAAGAFATVRALVTRAAIGAAPTRRWLHGAAIGALVATIACAVSVHWLLDRFVTPGLIGLSAGVLAVGSALAGLIAAGAVAAALDRRDRLFPDALARLDPLRSLPAAVVVYLLVVWGAFAALMLHHPPLHIVFPFDLARSLTLAALLAPFAPAIARRLRARRRLAWVALAGLSAMAVPVLAGLGVRDDAHRVARSSGTVRAFSSILRAVEDVDRDGYGALLDGPDCAPFDGAVHPGARDVPGDGIDQNCRGGDYTPAPPPSPHPDVPVPGDLARPDCNVLLITVDALRYDHTGPAGYRRPTTPALTRLAGRGAWFESAYATSPKTLRSLPTLVASRSFDAIAKGPALVRTQMGGITRPIEAITFAEVFAAAGHRTGMFTAHPKFAGWNIDQGFDHHVNAPWLLAGRPPADRRITDRALAWLEGGPEPWLAWLHYIGPHLPYQRHEAPADFGPARPDRYDAEVRHSDGQLARLLDWLDRDPDRAGRTIVVVTADHGEALGEHGLHGHPDRLWEPLIHVPLVIAVPGAEPRRTATPASLLDVAPTLAAFCRLDPPDSWRGRALVGAVTGRADSPDRVVFSATGHELAAITNGWKLIHDTRNDLYQLVDLAADPDERADASADAPARFRALRSALTRWRERVVGND